MSDDADIARAERKSLSAILSLFAAARELESGAECDARYTAAANNIRQIAATLDQVSDDVLLKLANVNVASEGLLLALIAARVSQIGFALPCCADAADFIAPIEAKVDDILHHAHPRRLH